MANILAKFGVILLANGMLNVLAQKIVLKVNNLLGRAQHRKWKTDFTAKLDQTFY